MHGEFADEAVVVIKQLAEEDMVTYQRVKLTERAKESKDEGRNMLTQVEVHEERSSRDKPERSEHRPVSRKHHSWVNMQIEERVIQNAKQHEFELTTYR